MEHQDRLNEVEAKTNALASDVAGIKRDVAHVSGQMSEVVGSVRHLASAVSSLGKTNWGTLGAWASVLAVCLGAYSELRMAPMNARVDAMRENQELRDKLAEERQRSHERLTQAMWERVLLQPYPTLNDR